MTPEEPGDEAGIQRAVVTGGSELTAGERQLAAWADKVTLDPLSVLRKTAQQWQATASAIMGLFGAASLIGGDVAVASLEPAWREPYVILVGVSLTIAGSAIWVASSAGQAGSTRIEMDLERLRSTYECLLESVRRKISLSRGLTFFAILFLALATGVRWYAPKKPSSPTRVELVQSSPSIGAVSRPPIDPSQRP